MYQDDIVEGFSLDQYPNIISKTESDDNPKVMSNSILWKSLQNLYNSNNIEIEINEKQISSWSKKKTPKKVNKTPKFVSPKR